MVRYPACGAGMAPGIAAPGVRGWHGTAGTRRAGSAWHGTAIPSVQGWHSIALHSAVPARRLAWHSTAPGSAVPACGTGTAQRGAEAASRAALLTPLPLARPRATRGPHWGYPALVRGMAVLPWVPAAFHAYTHHTLTLHKDICNLLPHSTKVRRTPLQTHSPPVTQCASSSPSPPGPQGPLTLSHSSCTRFSTCI